MIIEPFITDKKVYIVLNKDDMKEIQERLSKVNKGDI